MRIITTYFMEFKQSLGHSASLLTSKTNQYIFQDK
jgi:hypothetical protein